MTIPPRMRVAYAQHLDAPLDHASSLLCPVREANWVLA
mgnify:CR=1 FL=1|jgi:hypothetical protein